MADPLDFNPFLTESQRKQIRSNVYQGPSLSSIEDPQEFDQRAVDLGMVTPMTPAGSREERSRRSREMPTVDMEYAQSFRRQREAEMKNRADAIAAGQQPNTLMQLSPPPNTLNIKGIPADSQYAQEARRQAGISEAEFDRRLLEVLDVMRSPEYRDLNNPMPGGRSIDELSQMVEGLGVTGDAPFPGETRQIQRRPMPGGRSMDELRRQLDRVQRMEVQRAPQRQTPLVVARDEQIQGSDRGEMGRFYGPQGRTEDIDPLLIQATPQPRTSAQLAESARAKAGSGQPLDAEERQWFSSTIRKQMQDAGYTEEQIQRQMERIDPETGMLPRRMR